MWVVRMEINRWLITGGCGFIGTNLVHDISAMFPDDKIIIIDDLRSKTKRIPKNFKNIEFHCMDIAKINNGHRTDKIDYFIHLADEMNGVQSMNSNYTNLACCLNYARSASVKNFIFASSDGCVGNNPIPLDEKSAFNPGTPYAASKLCGEILCDLYSKWGLPTVSLRLSNVYGIYSKHKKSVVVSFINKIINDEPIEIYGNGKQTRDFIYIDDVVDAIIKAVKTKIEGVYCISSYRETYINELVQTIEFILNKRARIIKAPAKKKEVKNILVNHMKAVNDLSFSWSPTVSLNNGIKKTVKWMENN